MSVWEALVEEFATDLPDTAELVRVTLRLLVAAILGGVVGFQRQREGKEAGLRTHMLVSLGAALFVVTALNSGIALDQLSRVIQGVALGIGFIGGGVILKLKETREIHGLTTAADIWIAAAVGLACGFGRFWVALVGVLLTVVILTVFRRLEHHMGKVPR
jgi:putative Mg2+ transporter-C (MgtC) family protein